MSGGSYDHAYYKLDELSDSIKEYLQEPHYSPEVVRLRTKFAELLRLCAVAAHDIEWVDSGDMGDDDEVKAIKVALEGPYSVSERIGDLANESEHVLQRSTRLLDIPPEGWTTEELFKAFHSLGLGLETGVHHGRDPRFFGDGTYVLASSDQRRPWHLSVHWSRTGYYGIKRLSVRKLDVVYLWGLHERLTAHRANVQRKYGEAVDRGRALVGGEGKLYFHRRLANGELTLNSVSFQRSGEVGFYGDAKLDSLGERLGALAGEKVAEQVFTLFRATSRLVNQLAQVEYLIEHLLLHMLPSGFNVAEFRLPDGAVLHWQAVTAGTAFAIRRSGEPKLVVKFHA